jgi:hypothetical protein
MKFMTRLERVTLHSCQRSYAANVASHDLVEVN